MAFRATHRFARMSAQKIRLVADLIRGKLADDALNILRYQPQRGARLLEKVLKSALANAEDRGARDMRRMVIVDCRVDGAPMFKRIQPRSRGQAFMILKRSSHITIAVDSPGSHVHGIEEDDEV